MFGFQTFEKDKFLLGVFFTYAPSRTFHRLTVSTVLVLILAGGATARAQDSVDERVPP